MRRRVLLLLGVAGLLVGVAACGGGSSTGGGEPDKTFKAHGFGITFRYPAAFKPIASVTFAQSAGAEAVARAGVALDVDNAITVSRYALRASITKDNLDKYKSEVDTVIGRLAQKTVSGRQVEYGGLPGYEYELWLAKPAEASTRVIVLFDQSTEYLINCQSTPSKRDQLEAGCSQALDTLAKL
jgi:hypothetical protein